MLVFNMMGGKINSRMASYLFLILSLTVLLLQIAPAAARTLSVPESSPTIKGALIKAQPGDIVLVSCGTYYEFDIMMKPGVALWSGTLQPGCVTIDAQGKGRIFHFADGDTNTALVGFTLKGGFAQGKGKTSGGAVYFENSSPRISNCIFMGNKAQTGGAFYIDEKSAPVVANCLFENNEALTSGGGAHCLGNALFRQCAFSGNSALKGAGLNLGKGADVTMANCSLQHNTAGNTGGGLHLDQAQCGITNTIFSENWGGLGGSALSSSDSDLSIFRSTLYNNNGDTNGGVLAFNGQRPQVKNSIIAYSKSDILRSDSNVPEFQGCNLYGNENGDWVANLRTLKDKQDNISLKPQFCAPEFGNFTLKSSSACLPGNNPSGNKGIVGALGPGCISAQTSQTTNNGSLSGFQAVQAGM